MAWIPITKAEVVARLNDTELDVYETTGDDDPQDDKLTAIIKQVVDRFRGAIGSCSTNTSFGATGTLPPECIYHACSIIKHALIASIPNTQDLQPDERDREYDSAISYLRSVASCREAVSADSSELGSSAQTRICYGSEPLHDFSN